MVETTPDTIPVTPGPLSDAIERLKTTHRAIALTVDGQPAAILQDPAEYQRLVKIAAQVEEDRAIQDGLADMDAGRTFSLDEAFDEILAKYAVPR
jgi:hypothetical protein